MTDQLEVVSSPTEALELLEAGHYSSLDVEAFRCFANLYKGEDEVDEAMLTFALVALTRSQCCSTFAHTVTPR